MNTQAGKHGRTHPCQHAAPGPAPAAAGGPVALRLAPRSTLHAGHPTFFRVRSLVNNHIQVNNHIHFRKYTCWTGHRHPINFHSLRTQSSPRAGTSQAHRHSAALSGSARAAPGLVWRCRFQCNGSAVSALHGSTRMSTPKTPVRNVAATPPAGTPGLLAAALQPCDCSTNAMRCRGCAHTCGPRHVSEASCAKLLLRCPSCSTALQLQQTPNCS